MSKHNWMSGKQCSNSDQTPRSAASDLDLHCLLPVDVSKNGWISVKRVDLAQNMASGLRIYCFLSTICTSTLGI